MEFKVGDRIEVITDDAHIKKGSIGRITSISENLITARFYPFPEHSPFSGEDRPICPYDTQAFFSRQVRKIAMPINIRMNSGYIWKI